MTSYNGDLFDPPAPFALISVRNPQTKERISNIPMLLDTGADVSLLPTKLIEDLGFSLGEPQRLVGFDGNEHIFQTIDVQLIFLGKRFSGEFCLIDQESGILGRDILNSFVFVFDGVKLQWSEFLFRDLELNG